MKKKIITVLICGALTISLAACGSSSSDEDEATTEAEEEQSDVAEPETEDEAEDEDVGVLGDVDRYECGGVEDGILFWNVYFKDDADTDWYDNDDYAEIIKECLRQPETPDEDIIDFGIQGYDQDGHILFSWLSYDDKYTVKQDIWRNGQTNPDTYDWKFSNDDVNEFYNMLNE